MIHAMKQLPTGCPRIIWFLWFQGIDKAPLIVQKCYLSWKRDNPDWNVILLHDGNLSAYIDIAAIIEPNADNITRQAQSDIIRINLLQKYGGVWVDATCYCCQPLDKWLSDYLDTGFFAFRDPGPDRPIASWFLASCEGASLTTVYCEVVNSYWLKNRFDNQNRDWVRPLLKRFKRVMRRLRYDRPGFWALYRLLHCFHVYPYHWFHYLFARLIRNDQTCAEIWSRTRSMLAEPPHKLIRTGLYSPLTDELKQAIDMKETVLFKLNWKKHDAANYRRGCVLYYLLEDGCERSGRDGSDAAVSMDAVS